MGKNMHKSYTMHELSSILKIPYASFYRAVQNMRDLLIVKRIGQAKSISLDISQITMQSYLTIASDEEKKQFVKKRSLFRAIQNDLDVNDVILLFGSYAKGEESNHSDIDIMIINKQGKKTVTFSKYEVLYKKEINPIYFNEREFKAMLKDSKENVGKQALKGHVVLNNPKRFWELVLDAI